MTEGRSVAIESATTNNLRARVRAGADCLLKPSPADPRPDDPGGIYELVNEWTPEPLGTRHFKFGLRRAIQSRVLRVARCNFTGLASNETVKVRSIESLRKYGVGGCGPYCQCAIDVHMDPERDSRDLGTESSIHYSQTLSTIRSSFAKREDTIVSDRVFVGSSLTISNASCCPSRKRRTEVRGPLTRTFVVALGIFERDGAMVDLPKLATQMVMLVFSAANDLNSSFGFCAGSHIVPDHMRINCTSFVFSATDPALPDVSVSMGINILRNMLSIQSTLQENVRTVQAVLDRLETVTIPSYAASPIAHIHLRSATLSSSATLKAPNPVTTSPREPSSFDIASKRRMLQDIVDKVLERRKS
ncbi:hypothetical protein V8E53_003000 [Lactarius tabidus]